MKTLLLVVAFSVLLIAVTTTISNVNTAAAQQVTSLTYTGNTKPPGVAVPQKGQYLQVGFWDSVVDAYNAVKGVVKSPAGQSIINSYVGGSSSGSSSGSSLTSVLKGVVSGGSLNSSSLTSILNGAAGSSLANAVKTASGSAAVQGTIQDATQITRNAIQETKSLCTTANIASVPALRNVCATLNNVQGYAQPGINQLPGFAQQGQQQPLGFQRVGPFLVRLDSITVVNPRSPSTDTVYASLSGKVGQGGQPVQPATKFLGDLGKGRTSNVQIGVGPFNVPENQVLDFSYILENKGGGGLSQNLISVGEGAVGLLASPGVSAGVLAAEQGLKAFAPGLFPGGCNGIVAADEIVLSKAQLQQMTASGPHTERKYYPGTDSPIGCGANSRYYVTWTVMQAPQGVVQPRPLLQTQPQGQFQQPANPIVREHRTAPQ